LNPHDRLRSADFKSVFGILALRRRIAQEDEIANKYGTFIGFQLRKLSQEWAAYSNAKCHYKCHQILGAVAVLVAVAQITGCGPIAQMKARPEGWA
jgi:hypothetical protein